MFFFVFIDIVAVVVAVLFFNVVIAVAVAVVFSSLLLLSFLQLFCCGCCFVDCDCGMGAYCVYDVTWKGFMLHTTLLARGWGT